MSAPTMIGDAAVVTMAAGFNPLDATSVIAATGVIGILCVLIAETGLLVGFFLPGDSLLFTAGIRAASHGALHLPLGWVLLAAAAGALIGAQIGYWIGRTPGTRLRSAPSARRCAMGRPGHRRGAAIRSGQGDRAGPIHPGSADRDEPDGRDDADTGRPVHPVADRRWPIWSLGVTLAGYWLGSKITGIDRYLLPIIAVVVAVSLLPVVLEYRRMRTAGRGGPPGWAYRCIGCQRGEFCRMSTISYLEAIVIGGLQGVTELFPVSSLGHSIIIPALIGGRWWPISTSRRANRPTSHLLSGFMWRPPPRCCCSSGETGSASSGGSPVRSATAGSARTRNGSPG